MLNVSYDKVYYARILDFEGAKDVYPLGISLAVCLDP
jgi:hypothetical protein